MSKSNFKVDYYVKYGVCDFALIGLRSDQIGELKDDWSKPALT